MTAIVYDGKTLAADTQLFNRQYNIAGYQKKIFKWSKGYWAAAGSVGDEKGFSTWLEKRSTRPQLSKGFEALYSEDGEVFAIEKGLIPETACTPHGIGSAGNDCEVLCRVGYTAVNAIKAVMKWNISCGGKVNSVNV